MPYTFNGQDLLRIELETGYDISTATSLFILYEKPDGTLGSFVGTLFGTTKIVYDLSPGEIDQVGTWKLMAKAVIGGRTGYGDHVYMEVKEVFE